MFYVIGWWQRNEEVDGATVVHAKGWKILSGPHRSFQVAGDKARSWRRTTIKLADGVPWTVDDAQVVHRALLPQYGLVDPSNPHVVGLPGLQEMR